ncbi:MAG TPA: TIGR02281 family clan AA aspartic protease [Burkholderiales bacterium]
MKRACFMLVLALHSLGAGAVESVSLQALFKDKAILLIDGKRRVLAKGAASPEGVRLLATDTAAEEAEVEIDGRREILRLGTVIGSFAPTGRPSVTLWAGSGGHFHADGTINGLPVRFLVDTGATTIALSGAEASRLGIDYRARGRPSFASTAGGIVRTYALKLERVEVGPIALHDVDAAVIEGPYPREPLLGMSFLGRLDMKREGDRMELTQR